MSGAHAIETGSLGMVVCESAAICAPTRSSPALLVTVTAPSEPTASIPDVPLPHVMFAFLLSPHAAVAAAHAASKTTLFMCAQRTHSSPKLHHIRSSPKNGPRAV